MNYKNIQQAATESRMASAETMTTFGLQTSIDDAVALTGAELTDDEVAESAFEKGAEWLMAQPLSDRLTDDEIKRIKERYASLKKSVLECESYGLYFVMCEYERLFGEEFFNK